MMNHPEKIEMPAATAWPFVLAFGLTLVFAGLVTAASVTVLGAILTVAGTIGWFRQVLPVESHESAPVVQQHIAIATSRESVERVRGAGEAPRVWLPIETYPISAGVRGGLAGGVAMAALAALYGIVSGNGIWYPMNLLVAGLLPPAAGDTAVQIGRFNLEQFLVAVPLHLLISLLVGLLYGVMLPMAPKRPILLGGFVAPALWSFLIYGCLAAINPVMNQRIDWLWFVLSQIGFGMVAGLVVAKREKIRIPQVMPLALRMGIEAPGLMKEPREDHPEELRP
jgi:carbon starvation protein CstA